MTKVLCLYDGVVTTVELFSGFLRNLAERRGFSLCTKLTAQVTEADIFNCDVVLCIRGESPIMCEILKTAREAGRFVVFFLDDDLLHLPKDAFRFPGRRKYLLRCLKQADFFLTSSRLLLEEYLSLICGTRGAVIGSSVDRQDICLRKPKAEKEPVKIVFAGAPTHAADWNQFIAPIWSEIAHKYGNKISMTFVGIHPEMPQNDTGSKVEFVQTMRLSEYRQFMYSCRFDIGLSPLVANRFTARKHFNKFMEYSMCGICGIYSDCLPYTLVVRDGVNGLLSGNTPQEWKQTLERAIDDRMLRENCIANAQRQLCEEFSPEAVQDQLIRDIPELITFHAPTKKIARIAATAKIGHLLFRLRERLYLTGLSLYKFGFKETWKRIKSKLK